VNLYGDKRKHSDKYKLRLSIDTVFMYIKHYPHLTFVPNRVTNS